MGLITCSECGREISDKAGSCPGCGCPVGIYRHNPPIVEEKANFYNKHPWFSHNLGLNALVLGVFSILTLSWLIGMITAPVSMYLGIKAIRTKNMYKKSAISGIVISAICILMTVLVAIQIASR